MKNKKNAMYFIFMMVSVTIIGINFIFISSKYPYIGIDVEEVSEGVIEVSSVDKNGWGFQHGLAAGDTVVKVNDKAAVEYFSIQRFDLIEQAEKLVVERDGQQIKYEISYERENKQIVYQILFPLAYFLLCIGLSVFLFFNKGEEKRAAFLILFFITIGISALSGAASSRADLFARFVNGSTFVLTPVVFIQFIYHYFVEMEVTWFPPKIYKTLYGINLLIIFATIVSLLTGKYYSLIILSLLVSFFVSIVIALILLIQFYVKFRHSIYKPTITMLLTSLSIAFIPFLLLYLIPFALFKMYILSAEEASVFLLTLPVSFFYLISAERLLDIDFVFYRIRYYALLSFIPTILFMLLLVTIETQSIQQLIQISIVVYIGIIIFLYMKELFDYRLGVRLFAEKYNYQSSFYRFSQNVKKEMKVSGLIERLKDEIKDVLPIKNVCYFEVNVETGFVCLAEEIHSSFIVENSRSLRIAEQNVGKISQFPNGFCLTIGQKQNRYMFVWCSPKTDRTSLNRDELTWLTTIAYLTSVSLENLYQMEDLLTEIESYQNDRKMYPAWLSRMLFSLSEKERSNLSKDIHDTILQEQLFLYRKVDNLIETMKERSDIRKEISLMREMVLDNIHLTRETCHELRPPFLMELGIVEALENLFKQVQLRSNFTISHDFSTFTNKLNEEYAIHIYRIVQELLTNAMKHSEATEVELLFCGQPSGFTLKYYDNGIGMDLTKPYPFSRNIGLSGIKERVYGLNGEINIDSSPNNGMLVTINFTMSEMVGVGV